ncbi:MAG: DUF1311 domain-containing protein, partial [Bacteroidia bacterium]|nr:DUF1311 domain-containing protein [Bacteroidia bacterium]
MNLCARQEYNYLDSILNKKHNELISMLNTRIAEDSENQNLISLKDRYPAAQKQWIILKNNNVSVVREKYQNGSILPMATDLQKSMDTRNRIDFIDMILEGFQ